MARVIETIDGQGNIHRRREVGRMETTDHGTILKVLERRAKRFRSELGMVAEHERMDGRVDETGTLTWGESVEAEGRELAARIVEEQELQNINDELLGIHGVRPGKKPDRVMRLVYENANGIDGRFTNNLKVAKAKELHDELEVDVAAYNEHRLNMQHKLNKVGFSQLFWGGEAEVRSVVGHNVHAQKKRRVQEGGTSMLMFGSMIDYYDCQQSGRDDTGLGRWVVMTLKGAVTTRIVCGYNP